ncbi:MAG: hypothetical protein NC048_05110 [Bacteroides sp.]|nr:hypothetical protein [Ruminococcus flavefaciens]MCM1554855.1 hypothetical protein [Bacteroides sp.]
MKHLSLHLNARQILLCLSKLIFVGIGFAAGLAPLPAQDFTGIGKRKPFSFSGTAGAQASTRLNSDGSSDPFAYILSAQLNPVVYGFSLPLSLSFADSRFSYAQPFSRISFTPSYKWIKAYLGRTSMDMHPYGLAGHQFDGAGIQLESASFPVHFSAMYGRLLKARHADTLQRSGENLLPAYIPANYARTGFAFKLGFTHKKQQLDLHFFRAGDRYRSLPEDWRRQVAPQQNAVLALDFAFELYKGLTLKGQAGVSAHTSDTRAQKEKKKGLWGGLMRPFLPQYASTSLSTAYKVQLAYKGISVAYERVGPEYASLGAAYFNRDFENAVVAFTHAFKKVAVNAELGWQRDDLKNTKSSRMNRIVGSAYVNYKIDERFALTASYSNFTMHTQLKPVDLGRPDDPLVYDPDTVSYRQIAQQASFGLDFHTRPTARYRQQGGLEFSYQSSREKTQQVFSDYFYAAARHGIELTGEYRLNTALNFSTRIDRMGERKTTFNYHIGPSATLAKALFDKTLNLSAGLSYYFEMNGSKAAGGIADLRLRAAYTLKKAHEFELQVSGKLRSAFAAATYRKGQEFFAQVSYRYRFSINPFEKKKEKAAKAPVGKKQENKENDGE